MLSQKEREKSGKKKDGTHTKGPLYNLFTFFSDDERRVVGGIKGVEPFRGMVQHSNVALGCYSLSDCGDADEPDLGGAIGLKSDNCCCLSAAVEAAGGDETLY